MLRNEQTGFTLIELMITVIIIAILAAIAYPSYQKWVVASRRSDGQSALLQAAAAEEKFFSQCNYYAQNFGSPSTWACGTTPATGFLSVSGATPSGYYTLTIVTASTGTATYKINATPTGVQTKDTDCGTLTIDQAGNKSATGATPNICWQS